MKTVGKLLLGLLILPITPIIGILGMLGVICIDLADGVLKYLGRG